MSTEIPPEPSNVADEHETLRQYVRRAFERYGHCVVETDGDLDEVYGGRGSPERMVVVISDRNDPRGTKSLLRGISAVDPDCRPLIIHDADDLTSASLALRHGGHPCPLRPATDGSGCDPERLAPLLAEQMGPGMLHPERTRDADGAVAIVQGALWAAVDGRMLDSMVQLSGIDQADATSAAVDHLADVCASLLRRIRRRTRYPIPVDLVMARLDVPEGSDVGLCYTMLQRAALRTSGLDLDIDELFVSHGSSGALFGAFHSTDALVRFTAERWWRTPRSVLEELSASTDPDDWC